MALFKTELIDTYKITSVDARTAFNAWVVEPPPTKSLGNRTTTIFPRSFQFSIESYYIRSTLVSIAILLVPFLFGAILTLVIDFVCPADDEADGRVPRAILYKLPFFRSTIPFFFNGLQFFEYVS